MDAVSTPPPEEKKERKEKKSKSKRDKQPSPLAGPASPPERHSTDAGVAEGDDEEEDWDANRSRVEALCLAGPNHVCGDCAAPGTRWASINHGVFVCIRCSGVHRSLGTHISKVKSTNMDKWSVTEVDLMEAMGNRRGKALYEARLGRTQPPSVGSADAELRRFIERKYTDREFAAENAASVLKKMHKQVGYRKYKRSAGVGSSPAGGAAGGASSSSPSSPPGKTSGKDAKALREQTMKALYGDAAPAMMANSSKGHHSAPGGGPSTSASGGPSTPATAVAARDDRGGRKGKTIHGTFGVVNVGPDDYEGRLTAVLAAFGVSVADVEEGEKATPEETTAAATEQPEEPAPPTTVEAAVGAGSTVLGDDAVEAVSQEAPAAATAAPGAQDPPTGDDLFGTAE